MAAAVALPARPIARSVRSRSFVRRAPCSARRELSNLKSGLPQRPRWLLLQSGPGPSAENMAWDEALLRAVRQFGHPVLRLYAWTEPAATFGYLQRIADAERLTPLRPLIRRPTGGGLVADDGDWTYSLAFPPEDSWYGLKAIESYRRVHAWIQAAFARAGLLTELSAGASKEAAGQCFSRAERFDLLWQQRKI